MSTFSQELSARTARRLTPVLALQEVQTFVGAANLALRFLLELAALAALGVWGAHAGTTGLLSAILAIAAPLVAVVLWGVFVSPKAYVSVSWPARLGVELAVFCAAIAGLAVSGFPRLAAVFTAFVIVHQSWRLVEIRREER